MNLAKNVKIYKNQTMFKNLNFKEKEMYNFYIKYIFFNIMLK